MGGIAKAGKSLLEATGLKKANAEQLDPMSYSQLYDQALEQLRGIGGSEASKANRAKIESSLGGMLGELDNNQAARKANFQEDMARGFQADAQSLARAKGGTGSLQQALRPSGAMYDSQARARARGLTDLYGQGVQDLSNLQGVQGNIYSQDYNKARGIADLATSELAARRGILSGNADNRWNATTQQQKALGGTMQAAGAAFGGMPSGGGAGGGGSQLGVMAGPGGTGRAKILAGQREQDQMGSMF